MSVPLEHFIQQLENSGILAGDTIQDFIPPKASPKNAEDLARELVRRKKLTRFQAEEVWRGKGKSLVLGNYVLLEKIGAGGMGQVFKARHRRMDRIVAVKLLPAAMTKDKAAIARFEREVKAAAKINHPNIVTAYDADQANGAHFLVMELVEGSDLANLVKQNGPVSIAKALNYIVQAGLGLEAAHAEGIVHRDIKPANLLLDKKGTVKILDMGLARLSLDGAPQAELTSTGAIMGTIDYMAPEQALDTKTADARADIYSLGCSLYYLLTGKATYDGDTLMKKLLAHREQPIPPLRAARPEVSEQLDAAFRKMVAKKIEERYQTVREALVDLEQCRSACDRPSVVQEPPASSPEGALTAFLNDVSSAPTAAVQPHVKPRERRAGSNRKLLWGGGVVAALVVLAGVIVKLATRDGLLIVTVSEPDAEVLVLSADKKVEIREKGGREPISISVDPGKHRLKVSKEGFEFFTKDFEIGASTTTSIKAQLVPWNDRPGDARKPLAKIDFKPAAELGKEAAPPMAAAPTIAVAASVGPMAIASPAKPLEFTRPGFDTWIKTVAALPSDQQVDAVAKKLVELNPDFDGKVSPSIEAGVVTGLGFFSDHVTDISPVRALAQLRELTAHGQSGGARLADLSPLQGLPLTSLNIHRTQVKDLTPLQGMPLKSLFCAGAPVADLSPLRGMPLAHLQIEYSAVASLFPLEGMQLAVLNCAGTGVSDLSPLKDMPLKELDVYRTRVTDLTPLRGMRPTFLNCASTPVTNLSPLKDMPLQRLYLDFTPQRDTELFRSIKTLETINDKPAGEFCDQVEAYRAEAKKPLALESQEFQQWMAQTAALSAEDQVKAVSQKLMELNPGFDGNVTPTLERGVVTALEFVTDNVTDISPVRGLGSLSILGMHGSAEKKGRLINLAPVKGLELTQVFIYHTRVSDLSPLRGMKLKQVHLAGTLIGDLSPLKDMPLEELHAGGTRVSDLSPLKGMPLVRLMIYATLVSDLSPLQGMKLIELDCFNNAVTDFSFLKGMPLRTVTLDFRPERDTELLRSLSTLETINFKPTPEFWLESQGKASAKKPLAFETPGFDQWVKEVAALPEEKRVDAIARKLVELNPGFDGKVEQRFNNGIVVGFSADNVADISPVRALVGVNHLVMSSNTQNTEKLTDLSPLKGLPLMSLDIHSTHVADLAPLQGMPLNNLNAALTKIVDLSPLKGAPLNYLQIEGTPVSDLSPLQGLPLAMLAVDASQVRDLSPLKAMPLKELRVNTLHVTDISSLAELQLTFLALAGTPVSDLSPLKRMPLKHIYLDYRPDRDTDLLRSIKTLETINEKPVAAFCEEIEAYKAAAKKPLAFEAPGFDQWIEQTAALSAIEQVKAVSGKFVDLNPEFDGKVTPTIDDGAVTGLQFTTDQVTDLSPVRALEKLSSLEAAGSSPGKGRLINLAPLKGLPLTTLQIYFNPISDLAPLQGMKLTSINCSSTFVADLSPLKGMPLVMAHLTGTLVNDLSPLRGMPLELLHFQGTPVFDISPLHEMKLVDVVVGNHPRDLSPLKGMPLKRLACDFRPDRDTELLRSISTLELINEKPAIEFWQHVDGMPTGKQP